MAFFATLRVGAHCTSCGALFHARAASMLKLEADTWSLAISQNVLFGLCLSWWLFWLDCLLNGSSLIYHTHASCYYCLELTLCYDWNMRNWWHSWNTYCRSKVKIMAVSRLFTPPMQLPKSMNLKAKLTSCNSNIKAAALIEYHLS